MASTENPEDTENTEDKTMNSNCRTPSFLRALCVLCVLCGSPSLLRALKVEVVNNQPFPIHMPRRMLDGTEIMIDVQASARQSIDGPVARAAPLVTIEPAENGLRLQTLDQDLGTLQWDVIVEPIEKHPTDEDASKTKRDYDAIFKAMPLKFTQAAGGKAIWSAEAEKSGIKLSIEAQAYQDGFVDLRATFENQSAPTTKVYAAVVTRWQRPAGATSTVDYDNHIAPLPPGGATHFRTNGEKHLFLQRGVDWINTSFEKASVAWLNNFSQSFTIHHEKTAKTPAQWRGGDAPQLGQEAALSGDTLYSITEIARPQIKYYQGRFTGDSLPLKGDPLHFTSLLAIDKDKLTDQRVDQMFVGYTSYNEEKKTGDTTQLTLGVPYVKFGTAYFPYSTLGENFEHWHMPGMSKESYWPLAADVVKNYKLFADDIKRDLRILKAMGFQTVRLHHLEMLYALEAPERDAFLDFYFGQLKELGLTALIDVKLKPEQTAALVKKYRDQIDGVEVDNELLIFGTNDNEVEGWKETYKQVKEVAPDLPVHFTGQTNTGAFDRLTKLGVPFDRIGLHSYCDSLDAIQSTRDFALSDADYGSEIGKPPVITEWNWRFLTRMTPEDRAKVYPPIFENVFAARACPVFYQFQFQESLAMAPHTLRGIRHYDLLGLSRRPRPEALEFVDLIHKYGDPNLEQHRLRTRYQVVDASAAHDISVSVTHTGKSGVDEFSVSTEGLDGIEYAAPPLTSLGRTSTGTVKVDAHLPPDAAPGFYQLFVRFGTDGQNCSYAWVEIRKPGAHPSSTKKKGTTRKSPTPTADSITISIVTLRSSTRMAARKIPAGTWKAPGSSIKPSNPPRAGR